MTSSSTMTLAEYLKGFERGCDPWPELPLADDPCLQWWRDLLAEHPSGGWWAVLQEHLPQLLLPQREGISQSELYKALVLRGASPASLLPSAEHSPWERPQELELSIAEHPCGAMPVLRTASWSDFERLVRALAHRAEPVQLADGVHAQAISGLIHWGLIRRFGRQARAQLIVLHEAPYGSVPSAALPWNLSEAQWCRRSSALRLEHELTHLATKRVLGQMRINLLDELIADTMGMLQAMGQFSADVFGRCLGVDPNTGPLPQGRWITYVAGLGSKDAEHVLGLALQRAEELEAVLKKVPLNKTEHLLPWLCRQQLDQPILSAFQGATTPTNQGLACE